MARGKCPRICRIYKVKDKVGNIIFQGSVPEISQHFFIDKTSVYKDAQSKNKMLRLYTLEFDGLEERMNGNS